MTPMWEMLAGLSDQYRWALNVEVPAVPHARSVLVCGMGGSAISGDFAAAVTPSTLIAVNKGYSLPGWAAGVKPLVIAVSYSGNTEETRSAVNEALALDLPVALVTGGGALGELAEHHNLPMVLVPGGLQPRAALGYLTGALLRVLESAGVAPDQTDALEETASVVRGLWGDGRSGPASQLALDLADGLTGRVSLVYGSNGLTAPAAQRWKTQINENGKRPAFWSVLPELDHNEIVGWSALAALTNRTVGIVHLRDRDEHPQVNRRFALTTSLISGGVPVVGEVWSQGESALARVASLALVGDLVSVHLAEQEGVDPVPVDIIEDLKVLLDEE
jgi:glucose/mannose-6-phosphate isomerase